jgi:hypothetical protein
MALKTSGRWQIQFMSFMGQQGFVILEDNKNLIKFEPLDKLKNLYLSARAENELLVQKVIGYGSSRLRVSAGLLRM